MVAPMSWQKEIYGYLQGGQLQKVWDIYPKELAPILIHGSGMNTQGFETEHMRGSFLVFTVTLTIHRAKNHGEEIIFFTSVGLKCGG